MSNLGSRSSFELFGSEGALRRHWGWFLACGIAFVILGCIAISTATYTTLFSVILLGVLLLIAGVVVALDAFKFWWGKWGGFFAHLLMAILYLITGILFLRNPIAGAISLTLVLAVFFIILGIFRIITTFSMHLPHKGWALFNGLITLLLGILILAHWPISGLIIIGLFVGIELIITGWVYIMLSLAARSSRK